jgi:pyruvate dehydrogenase E1 component
MGAHQQKKLEDEALLSFRDRFALPISDEDVTNVRFHKPPADSPEMKYLHSHRQALGGYLPTRTPKGPALAVPPLSALAKYLEGTHGREQSTTMVFVQILSQLLRDAELGKHIVPIVADEARTFGMQALFRQVAIYSSVGQLYDPEDKDELLSTKKRRTARFWRKGSARRAPLPRG